MEEIEDSVFYKPDEIKYVAIFDPESGKVISIGPSLAFPNIVNQIEIDKDIAKAICDGSDNMVNYVVDIRKRKLEVRKKMSMITIDDLVHRIIGKKWTDIEYFDIYLTYSRKKNLLQIQMTEEFKGTKKLSAKFRHLKRRDVIWEGDLDLYFYITDYNDPNILYDCVKLRVCDLIGKTQKFENLNVPNKFSVFTRRIFENYVIDIK